MYLLDRMGGNNNKPSVGEVPPDTIAAMTGWITLGALYS